MCSHWALQRVAADVRRHPGIQRGERGVEEEQGGRGVEGSERERDGGG